MSLKLYVLFFRIPPKENVKNPPLNIHTHPWPAVYFGFQHRRRSVYLKLLILFVEKYCALNHVLSFYFLFFPFHSVLGGVSIIFVPTPLSNSRRRVNEFRIIHDDDEIILYYKNGEGCAFFNIKILPVHTRLKKRSRFFIVRFSALLYRTRIMTVIMPRWVRTPAIRLRISHRRGGGVSA